MKNLFFAACFAVLFVSPLSHAEHDASYCGRFSVDKSARYDGERPTAVLAIEFLYLTDSLTDTYESATGYGALFLSGEQEKEVLDIVRNAARGDKYCVTGRWGGSLYDSEDIRDIRLNSDNVESVKKFDPSDD